MKRLGIVDYLRGYSIFTIIVFHVFQRVPLNDILQKAINFGGTGVHVFVLCSGFGLYLSHLRKPLSYFSFIKKKALKIYIPYIIIVLLSFLVPFMYQNDDRWLDLLSHIFLFKMFVEKFMDSFGAQLWFISMIFQFYFIFPFLANFVDKNKSELNIGLGLLISLLWSVFVCLLGKYEIRVWNGFFLQFL
ncbi:Acyltransferase family protein [bacterium A37T11]|nr:Acyltransferase family protein [bacterium A37T11]